MAAAGSAARWRALWQYATFAAGVLWLGSLGWARLDLTAGTPTGDYAWLHGNMILMAAAVVVLMTGGLGLGWILPRKSDWTAAGRRAAPVLGGLAAVTLAAVLVQERALFQLADRERLAPWAAPGQLPSWGRRWLAWSPAAWPVPWSPAGTRWDSATAAGRRTSMRPRRSLSVIYVSSTTEFWRNIGQSAVLPRVTILLAVLGVLAGILLRVQSFLYLGFTFLIVVIGRMIVYAAFEEKHIWVFWVSCIVLGTMILALFALFEKRRNDVLATLEQFKQWER